MIKKLFKFILLKIKYKKINSLDVSISSQMGHNISIAKGTSIDSDSRVGDFTYIGKNCNITRTSIGRYCSIANNVSIGQGEHDISKISTSSLFYDNSFKILTKEPCNIGNDVWIGTDSVVLRGVTISDGVVIGANSVVTKDIPPFAIVAGSPARILRYRFDDEKQQRILDSRWWEQDLGGAKSLIMELEKC